MDQHGLDEYDVIVLGGGAAGLSGALLLARARRTVLVVDAGTPRNAMAGHVHSYLARDGVAPADLLAAGRAEVTSYGGEVVTGTAISARRVAGGGFRVLLAGSRAVLARRLLVTTGLVDELPDVPGVAQRWGREVVHCPYCHGWEIRDRAIAVLASGPMSVQQALEFRQWSAEVTLFLHEQGEPDPDDLERLAARGIHVVTGKVAALEVTGDRLTGVRLCDGAIVACEVAVVSPRCTVRTDLLAELGLELAGQQCDGDLTGQAVAAEPSGATGVPGVWVAGNIADPSAQVITAAAGGLQAAMAINADLLEQDVRDAVADRRRLKVAAGR